MVTSYTFFMALKIVLLALLVCCAASEAQSQGDDTSLPLSYNVTELQGAGESCPNDQLRQEAAQNIANDVRNILQNSVLPLLDAPTEIPTSATTFATTEITMPVTTAETPTPTPLPQCPCISGGGTRIANLDMTDPNQQCPREWTLIESPVRTCGRSTEIGCDSAIFPSNGTSYSQVCGRVRAYEVGTTDAFDSYNSGVTSIDSYYVDGVSITHGSGPRQHVWTFAAAWYEEYIGVPAYVCPCTNPDAVNYLVPPFVGDDYFCETGAIEIHTTSDIMFFSDDPLWDGEGCGDLSTCCELNNPPWFCKTLPQPTTDDIEVRICANNGISDNENIAVDQVEIYIM